MKLLEQLCFQLNRILGTSFGDETTEAEVVASLEKVKSVDDTVTAATAALSSQIEANATAIANLTTRVSDIESSEDLNNVTERVAALETSNTQVVSQVGELNTHVANLKGTKPLVGTQPVTPAASNLSKSEVNFSEKIKVTNKGKY